jgi:hypothetical protein
MWFLGGLGTPETAKKPQQLFSFHPMLSNTQYENYTIFQNCVSNVGVFVEAKHIVIN